MSPKKKSGGPRLLTEAELELMQILWKHGEATVNDVLDALPAGRKLAYTSVSTILRILESKKIVGSRKEGRGHAYYPLLSKESYETTSVHQLVSKVFEGEASSLVRRLIETQDLSEKELDSIRALLERKTSS